MLIYRYKIIIVIYLCIVLKAFCDGFLLKLSLFVLFKFNYKIIKCVALTLIITFHLNYLKLKKLHIKMQFLRINYIFHVKNSRRDVLIRADRTILKLSFVSEQFPLKQKRHRIIFCGVSFFFQDMLNVKFLQRLF